MQNKNNDQTRFSFYQNDKELTQICYSRVLSLFLYCINNFYYECIAMLGMTA